MKIRPIATEYMRRNELIELCFVRAMTIKRLEDKLQNIIAIVQDSTDQTATADMQKLKQIICRSK